MGTQTPMRLWPIYSKSTRARAMALFETALEQGIAAAPRAPQSVRDLIQRAEEPPSWLDWDLLELGCRTHLRCGLPLGVVLACCTLPLAYRSGRGNKPLMINKYLEEKAVERLSKTNGFLLDTVWPGSLRPHAAGWKKTLRVRMGHAYMRNLARRKKWSDGKKWSDDELGSPINQVDLAATCLLFSANLLWPLRKIGFHFSREESDGVMHLWRYSGHLLGVRPELLCSTEAEGRQLSDLLFDLAGGHDSDSVDLIRALMKAIPVLMTAWLPWAGLGDAREERSAATRFVHKQLTRFCYGLSQGVLGPRVKVLQYPDTLWRYAAPLLLWSLVAPCEALRRVLPGGTRLAVWLGREQFQRLKRTKWFAQEL